MDIEEILVNSSVIEQGEWIGEEYGTPIPEMGDICVRVRGSQNAEAMALYGKLYNATPPSQKANGELSPERQRYVEVEVLVETVLMDWKATSKGEPLPYSKEAARKILHNPDFRRFLRGVQMAAALVGRMRAEDSLAAAKN